MKWEFTQRPLLVDVDEEIIVSRFEIGFFQTSGNREDVIVFTSEKFAPYFFDENRGLIVRAKVDEHNIIGSLAGSSQERYNTQFDVASDSNDAQRDVRHGCCSRSCLSMLPHVFASQPLFAEVNWMRT